MLLSYCSHKSGKDGESQKEKIYFPVKNRRSFNRVRLDERNRLLLCTDEEEDD
jgi:hypothetical protein